MGKALVIGHSQFEDHDGLENRIGEALISVRAAIVLYSHQDFYDVNTKNPVRDELQKEVTLQNLREAKHRLEDAQVHISNKVGFIERVVDEANGDLCVGEG